MSGFAATLDIEGATQKKVRIMRREDMTWLTAGLLLVLTATLLIALAPRLATAYSTPIATAVSPQLLT
ncbi:MAG: hypothetical protein EA368_01255, partial [Leptolyngbya sp. DLM2.Bin27]